MSIEANQVVSISYTLRDDKDIIIDQTPEGETLTYLHGNHQLIPGLEKELAKCEVGQEIKVTIPPAEAYGERIPELIGKYPRDMFQGVDEINLGMQFNGQDNQGNPVILTVVGIEEEEIEVDGNHPLAGQTLHFEVKVEEVRAATEEELEHGHAHGPGGHHHDEED
jgi:FKBP-type peptidyl-prolyl cis-trans isomerase SlyD